MLYCIFFCLFDFFCEGVYSINVIFWWINKYGIVSFVNNWWGLKCRIGLEYLEFFIIFSVKSVVVGVKWVEKNSFVVMINSGRGEYRFFCFIFLYYFVGFSFKSKNVCWVFSYWVNEECFIIWKESWGGLNFFI